MTLPPVSTAYRWRRDTWGDALVCAALAGHAQHVFTTKQLQLHASDTVDAWDLVAASVGTTSDQIFRLKQVHGRTVRVVREPQVTAHERALRPEADAIVSDVSGVVLAVQVADCVPMLMLDPVSGAAAAVHAGWRGTAAGIGRETVSILGRELGVRPESLMVALGPSIGPCCYDVGDELIEAFRLQGATDTELARWFSRPTSGTTSSLRLDLWQASRDQLESAGVLSANIFQAGLCTQTHATVFDSYRVAGAGAGRMIAAIKVPHV
jgi:YfiH family protein